MRIAIALAAMMTLAAAVPAGAVTTVSAVLNTGTLAPLTLNNVAITPVSLTVGDTLDLTISFSGGPLTLGGGGALWIGLLTGDGSGTINTDSVLSFTGASANISGAGPLNQNNLFVHVGSYFGNTAYQTAAGPITFTSINQVVTLSSDDIGGPRSYDRAFFYYETAAVGGGVPEPASWAMLIAGFGLTGAAMRRRRIALAA